MSPHMSSLQISWSRLLGGSQHGRPNSSWELQIFIQNIILVKFNYEKYQARKYHTMIDAGANISTTKYNVLPEEQMKKGKSIRMTSAGKEVHLIQVTAQKVKVQIGDYELQIPQLFQFNETTPNIILGMDFLSQLFPLHFLEKALVLTF